MGDDSDNLNLGESYWRVAESRLDKIKMRLFESPHLFTVLDSVMTELDLWDEPKPTDYARNLILQAEAESNQNGR